MHIVYMDGKKEPYTTHDIIAEHAEIDIVSVRKLIDKHKKDLETFGILSFEMTKIIEGRGRPRRIYHLNEQQATLLVTYLGNTEPVREFKKNLVKAFFELRHEVAEFRYQRAIEKPKRKELVKAISEWENAPKHAHSTVTNLLLKGTTGMNKRQLVAKRGGYNGIDSLTSYELKQYQALEDMAIALINLNFSYAEIKSMVFRQKENAPAGA